MNSFSFLIAFVAACTLPIAYGNPCGAIDSLDCGGCSPGGHIVSAGRMIQANAWPHSATLDTGACCNTDDHIINSAPLAPGCCNTLDAGLHCNSLPAPDCLDNAAYNHGYLSGYGIDGDCNAPAEPCCNEPQPPRMLISHQRNPIVVNRPATNVVVNQPADIVQAKPVLIKRPPGVVVRPIIKNIYPRPVKVQPVIVRAIRPVEKHFVKKSYVDCDGPVWSHTKVVPDC